MANDEAPKKSLRDIAARAKEAKTGAPASSSSQDLVGLMQARPSSLPPPPSAPPGSLRPSAPPPSAPPGSLSAPLASPSVRPAAPSVRPSAPPAASSIPSAPPPAVNSPRPSSPPSAPPKASEAKAGAPEAKPAEARPAQEEPKSSMAPLIAVGLAAMLGIGFMATRKSEPAGVPLSTTPATTASATAEARPEPRPEPKPEVSAAAVASAAPADSGAIDINALASNEPLKAAPKGSARAAASDKAEAAPPTVTSEPVAVASAAPRPMGSVGELHDEMRKRVGATDQPTDQPSDAPGGNPNAKQEKPSNAAVLGALGAVRGAVKGCIADTDKATRISVTFQSDGSVRSVAVSGGAAGKPAEACVVAAVKKARVAPFMVDSFSTSFSVSP